MRRPTFERWIAREIQHLSGSDSLNLRKLAAMAQDSTPRLVEPLFLYAFETGKIEALLDYLWRDDVRASYKYVLEMLEDQDSMQATALSEGGLGLLPRDYSKHLASFRAAYNRPETDAESKRMRWERSRDLQLKKGISNADIYNALGLNPGNVNAYMKHGALDKVSLQNSTDIMKYLYAID